MLKKELMNELNNENHYTVPRYVLSYAKELGLDMDSLILLIYFLNKPNKSIFDYKKIIEDINFTEKELLNALSTLKDKNILLILMEKNDSGVLEEKVDISLFYEIIFSKILNKETKENNEKDLYDNFEKEFGRTLSPMEYEIINSWKEQKISNELILSALKEAVFNGVNNLRYIDKILYEWNKKGIKKPTDIIEKQAIKYAITYPLTVDEEEELDELEALKLVLPNGKIDDEKAADNLAYLKDFSLPYSNNISESDLRIYKIKIKVSGGFRSKKGSDCFADALSIIKTSIKRKENIMQNILNVFNGKVLFS